jgi:hypothetical protein
LARDLARELAGRPAARLLLLGVGNGRNVPPFTECGVRVDAVEEDPGRASRASVAFAADPRVRISRAPYAGPYPFAGPFAGALSTSALLHGAPASLASVLAAVRGRLAPGAPLFATFGSTRDERFERGLRLDAATFAPLDGDEAGVPHAFFDESRLRALLADFQDVEIEERSAAETVGRWAHSAAAAATMVHWFVRARAPHVVADRDCGSFS